MLASNYFTFNYSTTLACARAFAFALALSLHDYWARPLNHQSCSPDRDLDHLHDTTGGSSTGVTGLERIGVTSLTEIILTGVNNNGSANDGLGAEEGDVLV